jgi:hypothetical protein
MSELSYNQKRELVRMLEEAFSYDPDRRYPTDTASEIVDSWLPVYYNQIREEWVEAGCPEPDETMPDNNEHNQINIHNLMTLGLWETAHQFASGAIWSSCENGIGEPNTHTEALQNLRENYLEHVKIDF